MQKYYVTETLGEVQKRTPEGYLLCVGVPIARTGTQEYQEGEIDGIAASGGMISVERPEEVVFNDETIASFEGKPFTVDHPAEGVDVNSWKSLACGMAQNIRRGEGDQSDLLIADILVTSPEAIADIDAGVREISCGYDADYEQIEPGTARVTRIIGNHIALVPRGRAGKRCAIGDKQTKGEGNMEKKKVKFLDWLTGAWKKAQDEGIVIEVVPESNDPAAVADEPEPSADPKSSDEGGLTEVVALLRALMAKLDGASVDNNNPAPTPDNDPEGEESKKTADRAKSRTVDAGIVTAFRSGAEILSPGYETSKATTDSADSIVAEMRKVLDAACVKDEDVRREVAVLAGGSVRNWGALDAASVQTIFRGAVELAKRRNNKDALVTAKDFGGSTGSISPEKQTAINTDFWKTSYKMSSPRF